MKNIGKHALLTCLYFVQGLPYGIQSQFIPIYLHSKTNLSVSKISFLKFLSFPWLFKFVWGPLVDLYGTKKRWLCATSLVLALVCFAGSITSPQNIFRISCVLLLMNLFISVQDVVVDATTVSLLNADDIAIGNIVQVVGYKLGNVFSGGILTSFIDITGWTALFCIIAVLYLEAAILVFVSPIFSSLEQKELLNGKKSRNINCHDFTCHCNHSHGSLNMTFGECGSSEPRQERHGSKSRMGDTLVFLHQMSYDGETLWMLIFLLVYKLGEQSTLSILPMYLLHKGVETGDVTFWLSLIGQALSIFGSIAGGVIAKFTSQIIPIESLLQQVCLLRLLPIVCHLLITTTWDSLLLSKQTFLYMSIASGLLLLLLSGIITTITFTLMMQSSKKAPPEVRATYLAVMSTAEVLGKLLFTSFSGWIVEMTDYSVAFLLFAFLSVLVLPLFNKISHGRAEPSVDINDGMNDPRKLS